MTKSTPAPDAVRLVPDDVIVRGLKLMADHFKIETPLQREFNVRGWPNMSAKTSEALSECATMAAERLSMVAAAPAPATARGGEALRALRNLAAPFGGYIKKHAPALYDDMQAALASQPQATGGAVEREAVRDAVDWLEKAFPKTAIGFSTSYQPTMTAVHTILAAIAPQPAPSPGGDGHIPPVSEATIAAYEDAHAVSVEMGYPSITEALEHLSELLEPAAPSIQKGGEG